MRLGEVLDELWRNHGIDVVTLGWGPDRRPPSDAECREASRWDWDVIKVEGADTVSCAHESTRPAWARRRRDG